MACPSDQQTYDTSHKLESVTNRWKSSAGEQAGGLAGMTRPGWPFGLTHGSALRARYTYTRTRVSQHVKRHVPNT